MSPLRPKRRVLVVEDAITVRSMLEYFFTMHGYDVLLASHPDTALRRLKTSAGLLDAVILDIRLDDNRSGLEVLELMRLDDRLAELTVVVLTGLPALGPEEVEIIRRNRAYLLYKQDGYERVFGQLDRIIKPRERQKGDGPAPAISAPAHAVSTGRLDGPRHKPV